MDVKTAILTMIAQKGVLTSMDVVQHCGISRQAAARHLASLVAEGAIGKLGSTRSSRYVLIAAIPPKAPSNQRSFSAIYQRELLAEDLVFHELDAKLGLRRSVSKQAYHIPPAVWAK